MGTEINTSIRRQLLIASCLYLGQLLFGFTMGWAAPVLAKLQDPLEKPFGDVITDAEASWVASISFIGVIGGSYLIGYLSNVVGRKPCLYLGGSLLLLSYTIMAASKQLALLYVARIIVGLATGTVFITNLIYIGETASPRIRGTLLTLTGLSGSLGILLVYSVGPFVSYAVINWIAAALAVVYLIGVFLFVTETAVYLAMKGKKEEAMAILRLLGRQEDIDEVITNANFNEKPKSKISQLTELYTVKSNRRAAFIITTLNVLSQMSGLMAVIAFITIIFEMSGSNLESHISTIIIGVTQVVASFTAPILVDRIGRKSLLLFSSAFCSISLVILGTYFHLYNSGHPAAENLQWVSLVSVMLFFIAHSSGLGIIPSTFIGEMFTDNCRSSGGSIAITISLLFGFGVATAFGYMLPAWGLSVIFWMYAGACIMAFFFTLVFVPETKGKSLLEIQQLLSR